MHPLKDLTHHYRYFSTSQVIWKATQHQMDQTCTTENTKRQLEQERVEPSFTLNNRMNCYERNTVTEKKRSLDGGNGQENA